MWRRSRACSGRIEHGCEPLVQGGRLTRRARAPVSSRRIAGGAVVSLILHGVVILALWPWGPRPPREEFLPPGAVSMVFNDGGTQHPGVTEPSAKAELDQTPPPAGGGEAVAPQGGGPPEPVPLPPEPVPPEPVQPEPVPSEPVAPEPVPTPVPVPPAPAARPPAAMEPSPPVPVAPPMPPVQEPVMPPAPAAPATPPMPRQTTPATPSIRPRPAPDFPAPSDFSLGPNSPSQAPKGPGKPMFSLNMGSREFGDSLPFSMDTDAEVGPDWRNAFIAWVQEHAYYPNQAAALGQEGKVRVVVTARPDGQVLTVEMEKRSGSPWLDLALLGLFRGAKLPPMPKSVGEQPVPFHFTMHYILVR